MSAVPCRPVRSDNKCRCAICSLPRWKFSFSAHVVDDSQSHRVVYPHPRKAVSHRPSVRVSGKRGRVCVRVRWYIARADAAASTVSTASAASAKRYITPGQSRNAIQRSKLRIYTELIGWFRWFGRGFASHSTQNRSFRRRSSFPARGPIYKISYDSS